MAKQKEKDLDGKQLRCLGRDLDRPENVSLRLHHSDPSRRSVDYIDIARDMILRVPQDISEPDARRLLEDDIWHFRLEDQPEQEKAEAPKGDK